MLDKMKIMAPRLTRQLQFMMLLVVFGLAETILGQEQQVQNLTSLAGKTTTEVVAIVDFDWDNQSVITVAPTTLHPPWHEFETHLFRRLLYSGRYLKDARPCKSADESLAVTLEMVLMKINHVVERDQEIIITGYIKMSWQDERLSWKPADYGGVEWVVVPTNHIWVPDIGLINSADMYSLTRDFRFPAVVDYLGNIIWVPAGKLAARCEFDITYFPFDNQSCYYRLESWSYPLNFLNLTGKSLSISPAHYVTDQQWHLTGTAVKNYVIGYEEGALNFSRIDFVLYLHRKPLYFVSYTIMPALVLSMLQVFSHFLPVDDTDNRIGFATTGLISFSVLHVSISEQMPRTSLHLPIIAVYVDVVMGLIGSFIIESFFVSHILHKSAFSAPPQMLWVVLVEILGRISFFPVEKYSFKYSELKRLLVTRRKSAHLGHHAHHHRPKNRRNSNNNVSDVGESEKESGLDEYLRKHHPQPLRFGGHRASSFQHLQKRRLSMLRVGHKEREMSRSRAMLLEGVATKRRASPIRESEDELYYGGDLESDFSLSNSFRPSAVANHYSGSNNNGRSPLVAISKRQQQLLSQFKNTEYDSACSAEDSLAYRKQAPCPSQNRYKLSFQSDSLPQRGPNSPPPPPLKKPTSPVCKPCATVLKSMGSLREDVALLRELCDELAERQLKELSLEVWTTIFEIVDRYLFFISLAVAICTPAFLFLIMPPPMRLENSQQNAF